MLNEYLLAQRSAFRHLEIRKKKTAAELLIGECSQVYWWSDDSPLFEFPIFSRDRQCRGYVITAGRIDMPAILESSAEGPPLSEFLRANLWKRTTKRGLVPLDVRWYYLSPFEQVALINESNSHIIVRVPDFKAKRVSKFHGFSRDIEKFWSKDTAASSHELLADLGTAAKTFGNVLTEFQPVKYNQTCENSPRGLNDENWEAKCEEPNTLEAETYCSPVCIAGCVPVAWAMLASAYKRGNYKGKGNALFTDAPNWDIDWPWGRNGTPEPASPRVNRFIWDAHQLCNTSCGGATFDKDFMFGERLFWTYGLNWKFQKDSDVTWGDVVGIIERRNPFLLAATYAWHDLLLMGEKSSSFLGGASHMVCVYGHEDGFMLKVCMGWGDGVADKAVRFEALENKYSIEFAGERSLAEIETEGH